MMDIFKTNEAKVINTSISKTYIMKTETKKILIIFLAGFFAKDVIDDIFFLMIDKYPIEIFDFQITATSHKIMLLVSLILTSMFLYYGLRKNKSINQKTRNV